MNRNEAITVALLLGGSALLAWRAPDAWLALLVVAGAFALIWLLSLKLKDASILDIAWGPGFLLAATVYLLQQPTSARGWLVFALVALWGLRLGAHIGWRKRGHGEDARYQEFRRNGGANYPLISLFKVFGLQAWMLWVISMPLKGALASSHALNWIDLLALLIFALGFLFEAIADWQLKRFKDSQPPKGSLLTSGLWALSRHPNYFGEALLWWGFYLFAVAAGAAELIIGPILITFMLLKVSGVSLLEKSFKERPGFEAYQKDTPAFFPRWPRR